MAYRPARAHKFIRGRPGRICRDRKPHAATDLCCWPAETICVSWAMVRDEIIAAIRAAAPALKAEGVTRLAIFGSRARGDARPDSDLDVLVEVDPVSRFSMLDLIGVEYIIRD